MTATTTPEYNLTSCVHREASSSTLHLASQHQGQARIKCIVAIPAEVPMPLWLNMTTKELSSRECALLNKDFFSLILLGVDTQESATHESHTHGEIFKKITTCFGMPDSSYEKVG